MTRDELLRKWVEALESGKYQQGRAAMHIRGKFCCLGVLCDVSGFGVWADDCFFESEQFGTRGILLPSLLREYAGISELFERSLASANDSGVPFQTIAQRIREMFPDVFSTVAA